MFRSPKVLISLLALFLALGACKPQAPTPAVPQAGAYGLTYLVNIQGKTNQGLKLAGGHATPVYSDFPMRPEGAAYDAVKPVEYFKEDVRFEMEVDIDSSGKVAWAVDIGAAFTPGNYIFVMDSHGRIYAGTHVVGRYHHSTFLAGGKVSAAGEFTIGPGGTIVAVNNTSGHYKLSSISNEQFITELQHRGVTLNKLKVTDQIDADQSKLKEVDLRPSQLVPEVRIDRALEQRMVAANITAEGTESGKSPAASGKTTMERSPTHTTFTYTDGTTHRIYDNGVEEIQRPGGPTYSQMPDGKSRTHFPTAQEITWHSDGSKTFVLNDKMSIAQSSNGDMRIQGQGAEIKFNADKGFFYKDAGGGSQARVYANGVKEVVKSDGTRIIVLNDGTKMVRAPSAALETKAPVVDPASLGPAAAAQGSVPLRGAERLQYEAFALDDGRLVDANGKSIEALKKPFAMDSDGRIFIVPEGAKLSLVNLVGGLPAAASGTITVQSGKLLAFDNDSLEFRDVDSNSKFAAELSYRGFKATDVEIGTNLNFEGKTKFMDTEVVKVGGGYLIDGQMDPSWEARSSNKIDVDLELRNSGLNDFDLRLRDLPSPDIRRVPTDIDLPTRVK